MEQLLIMACSQRKNPARGLLPAIERYDGSLYFVPRKYLREPNPDPPKVLILSANFGLIPADRRIPDYDCRLTRNQSEVLRPEVVKAIGKIGTKFSDVLICAGREYKRLILGAKAESGGAGEWMLVPEGQGPKLGYLSSGFVV